MALAVRNGRGLAKVGMVKIFPPFLPNKLLSGQRMHINLKLSRTIIPASGIQISDTSLNSNCVITLKNIIYEGQLIK